MSFMKKWMYELIYRLVPADVIFGSTSKIEHLTEQAIAGRIEPCKAITLGCGEGRETIYLAKKGFDVTGVDFSPTAIKKARRKAKAASLEIPFIVDDLTDLRHVTGTYDLVTDFGALNDLGQGARDRYMENVVPLTHHDSHYVMFCFERMLSTDEVERRFKPYFDLEVIESRSDDFPGNLNLFWMTRKEAQ